jgi:hypothetical protein
MAEQTAKPHSMLIPQFSDPLVQNSRYKDGTTKACSIGFSVVPYRALQSEPLPCNYNVIQPVSALSRRRRGFKSRRGRQINNFGEKRLLSV